MLRSAPAFLPAQHCLATCPYPYQLRNRESDLYGLAAVDAWRVDPATIRTSYCYLRAGGPAEIDAVDWDPTLLGEVRSRLGRALDGLTLGRFPTTPGSWCRRCDFLAFCPSGQAAVADDDR